MNKLDSDIRTWAEDQVKLMSDSGFNGINAVEKIIRDPGIATSRSQHKVLYFPPCPIVSRLNRAAHQLFPAERLCLIVRAGVVLNDDGSVLGEEQLIKSSSLTPRKYRDYCSSGKAKLKKILLDIKNLDK